MKTLSFSLLLFLCLLCASSPAGAQNQAAQFDGKTGYYDTRHTTQLDLHEGAFTIQFWIRREGDMGTNAGAVVSKKDGHPFIDGDKGTGYGVYINQTSAHPFGPSRPFLCLGDGTYYEDYYPTDQSCSTQVNQWIHFSVTYNYETHAARWYVNGQIVATSVSQSGTIASSANAESLTVGSDRGASFLLGSIDELRIWRRALSAEEIAANYNTEVCESDVDLVAYFRFDGLTSVLDQSGYHHDLSMHGSVSQTAGPQFLSCPATIKGTITCAGTSLAGIKVTLHDENGEPVPNLETATTDNTGLYAFEQVPVGSYQVMVIEPLGYTADTNPKSVSVTAGTTATLDFMLTKVVTSNLSRQRSYWRHQFDMAAQGRKSDETNDQLAGYITEVQEHYTPHFDLVATVTTIADWQDLLRRGSDGKRDDAMAELAAFLMNLTSLKVGQYTPVTEDNRTAGDVLIYCSTILAKPSATEDELNDVREILSEVNKAGKIKSGVIPTGTILYKSGENRIAWKFGSVTSYALYVNYPNPFNPTTTIRYALPQQSHVMLTVYSLLGQKVAELVNGEMEAGYHSVQFNGTGLASGLYFCRLQAGVFMETNKLLLVR